ncbi:MAG: hypothetical protein ISEC1_P1688 [Thiomicrorhabdus sp.]|nr:MAG: hypothetical protein ISEC1_P1688 [Thiomicrorhabdus sp.]
MKLKQINIENFRSIEQLTLNLGERLTLLIGENGSGKTSVLNAISIGLGAVVTHLPNVTGISFKKNGDLRKSAGHRAPYARVSLEMLEGVTWDRVLKRDKSRSTLKSLPSTTGIKQLEQYLNERVIDPFNQDRPFNLPLFVSYGVSRALLDVPLRRKGFSNSHSRFDALAGALNADSRFKSAFIWFYNKENEEHRLQKESRSFDVSLPELNAVRFAIEEMFIGLSEPHIKVNPLQFVVKKDGQFLNIDQLSDGYKTLLGLVIDLSSRMAMANPHSSQPLAEEAIVMIDEVDLHLHPAWQKTVIGDLLRTFPNTQFIVTTHSPYIVEAVNNSLKRFQVNHLLSQNDVSKPVQKVVPLSASEVTAYVMTHQGAQPMLDNKLGLIDDKLLANLNDINALYDEMRDLEWKAQHG